MNGRCASHALTQYMKTCGWAICDGMCGRACEYDSQIPPPYSFVRCRCVCYCYHVFICEGAPCGPKGESTTKEGSASDAARDAILFPLALPVRKVMDNILKKKNNEERRGAG